MVGTDIEQVVCQVSDLKEGEFKEFSLGDEEVSRKILLIKSEGKIYATGNKCTHYGAPLKNGSLCQGKIRCPWHGACFNIKTGDIEDHPGLDSIHSFPVEIRGENVIVKASSSAFGGTNWKRSKKMATKSSVDQRLFLLIGGGPASTTCAQVLREEGFRGRIMVISEEKIPSYDRPKLSKAMNFKPQQIELRSKEFYKQGDIQWRLGYAVVELNVEKKYAKLNNGEKIRYDSVFVATGGIPRKMSVKGNDLANIFTLRTLDDALKIEESLKDKDVIVVGSSFIGMEVASYVVGKAKKCTVIGTSSVPFERSLGKEIGSAFMKLHESKGVHFQMGRTIKEFMGKNSVNTVLLDNGKVLEADTVILGIGVIPATSFIKNGVKFEKDKSIIADECLKAGDRIYVGGDICTYPFGESKTLTRIEHWGMAHAHGRVAAQNMLGKKVKMNAVPFFWTTQFGKNLRYCGNANNHDEVIIQGDVENLKFLAFYVKNNHVVAAASMGRDPVVSCIAQLIEANAMPDIEKIKKDEDINWVSLAAQVQQFVHRQFNW